MTRHFWPSLEFNEKVARLCFAELDEGMATRQDLATALEVQAQGLSSTDRLIRAEIATGRYAETADY